MKEIKKFDAFSVAKIYGISMAILGVFIGIIFGFIGFIAGTFASFEATEFAPFIGAGIGFASIIIFPIFYGVIGFIAGALGALIYNLVANWVGGIKLELADTEE